MVFVLSAHINFTKLYSLTTHVPETSSRKYRSRQLDRLKSLEICPSSPVNAFYFRYYKILFICEFLLFVGLEPTSVRDFKEFFKSLKMKSRG